jgi:hypothetical protein
MSREIEDAIASLANGDFVFICNSFPAITKTIAVNSSALGDYPGLYWCRNDEDGFCEFLARYTPRRKRPKGDRAQSCLRATERLIHTLRDLLP